MSLSTTLVSIWLLAAVFQAHLHVTKNVVQDGSRVPVGYRYAPALKVKWHQLAIGITFLDSAPEARERSGRHRPYCGRNMTTHRVNSSPGFVAVEVISHVFVGASVRPDNDECVAVAHTYAAKASRKRGKSVT